MRFTMYLVACSCNTIDCLRKESFKRQLKQLLKINDKKKKMDEVRNNKRVCAFKYSEMLSELNIIINKKMHAYSVFNLSIFPLQSQDKV